jgi:hypothetical protein
MTSNRSVSSDAIPRENSSDLDNAQPRVHRGDRQLSDGPSEGDLGGPAESGDEDGDLFGDDGDGEAYIKPYVILAFMIE